MLFTKEQEYSPLPKGGADEITTKNRRTRLQNYICVLLIIVVLLWASLTVYLAALAFPTQFQSDPKYTSCGNDTTTALERGCSFDSISFSWQTPECFNSHLVSEFASWKNWTYWTEKRGNVTVPKDIALKGNQNYWVTWEYHLVHCTFVWRQQQISYERGWIDSHVRSYPHTLHCQQMLFLDDGLDPDDNMILVNVQYPTCERIGAGKTWEQMDPVFSRVGDKSKHTGHGGSEQQ